MERSTEVEDAFRLLCELRSAAEGSRFDEVFSSEYKLLIGPEPQDWYQDIGFLREAFGTKGVTVSPTDPVGYAEGDMGWVSDRPTFTIPPGRSATLRTTAVMRRENGRWKLVHLHNSGGASLEELFS